MKIIWHSNIDRGFLFIGFTGIDSVYEVPSNPDLILKAGELSLDECVGRVVAMLNEKVCSSLVLLLVCV